MTHSASPSWIEILRREELQCLLPFIPPRSRILELGAGSGFQARLLAQQGFDVVALDIPESRYGSQRVWKVMDYDGIHIPFEDRTFDVVFTSNVLEHVRDLRAFLAETRRVLKESGFAVHVVPSSTWRLWTSFAHYLHGFRVLLSMVTGRARTDGNGPVSRTLTACQTASGLRKLLRTVFPPPHGATGTSFTELFLYNRVCWRKHFEQTGWTIEKRIGTRIFYTGYELLTTRLPLHARRILGRLLGSSTHIFLLRKSAVSH